jgi:hypothetical protein
MNDNSTLNDPAASPSKKPEGDAVHLKVSETNQANTETEPMEVHHHSHAHGKKNWKSYFWEFLMLFLAVFCGFLAEYRLEHVIENQREEQYMQSLVYDLQNDVANLNAGFPLKDERLEAIESMFRFFQSHPDTKEIPGTVYRDMRRSLWDRHYRRNTTTMDQLKNSGGLRLIRKTNVRDSIAEYDLQWQRAEYWREGYFQLQQEGKNLVQKIVNANDLLSNYTGESGYQYGRNVSDSARIRVNVEHVSEFLNFCADQKITTSQDKSGYQAIGQMAERLIVMINKEYGFE